MGEKEGFAQWGDQEASVKEMGPAPGTAEGRIRPDGGEGCDPKRGLRNVPRIFRDCKRLLGRK